MGSVGGANHCSTAGGRRLERVHHQMAAPRPALKSTRGNSMAEHPHVKSARHLAEMAKANHHEVKGYFDGHSVADKEHPRIKMARELADAAGAHHQAVSGYMQAQASQTAQPQASDMDWRSQTPTGQFPAGKQ
jgi:hypothetical protein